MRPLLLAAALAAAPLATAQEAPPSETPDAGLFVEIGLSGGYSSSGLIRTARATVGYRLPSGLHAAVTAHENGHGDARSSVTVGPEVGYTRALGGRTTLAIRLDGRASFFDGRALEADGYRATGLGSVVEAAFARRFGLGGGVDLAATAGLYGAAARAFDVDLAPSHTRVTDRGVAEAGAVVGLQVEFDALGGRFAVGPHGGVPVASTHGEPLGGGLYEGRGRGFVTFSF